jgi:hypothetical protein
MPDDSAVYGIVQTSTVQERLIQDNAASARLLEVLFELQANPRPPHHQPADEYGEGISVVVCESVTPHQEIIYRIDDANRRVVILAITELRWR